MPFNTPGDDNVLAACLDEIYAWVEQEPTWFLRSEPTKASAHACFILVRVDENTAAVQRAVRKVHCLSQNECPTASYFMLGQDVWNTGLGASIHLITEALQFASYTNRILMLLPARKKHEW